MLNLYAVVLTVIVAALLTVSIWQMRKVHTKADYLVAGRSLPAYVLVLRCSHRGLARAHCLPERRTPSATALPRSGSLPEAGWDC